MTKNIFPTGQPLYWNSTEGGDPDQISTTPDPQGTTGAVQLAGYQAADGGKILLKDTRIVHARSTLSGTGVEYKDPAKATVPTSFGNTQRLVSTNGTIWIARVVSTASTGVNRQISMIFENILPPDFLAFPNDSNFIGMSILFASEIQGGGGSGPHNIGITTDALVIDGSIGVIPALTVPSTNDDNPVEFKITGADLGDATFGGPNTYNPGSRILLKIDLETSTDTTGTWFGYVNQESNVAFSVKPG